jgi:alpha-amylase
VDGAAYRLANVWMLGQDYGYPVVMSGYAFDRTSQIGRDAGPPAARATVNCATSFESAAVGQWTCEHRDPWIVAMVGFRKTVAGTTVTRTWDNSGDAVAFARGTVGFVLINNGASAIVPTINTGLPAGTYCDLLTGGRSGSACVGRSVIVATDGTTTTTLSAQSAVVIHTGQRL